MKLRTSALIVLGLLGLSLFDTPMSASSLQIDFDGSSVPAGQPGFWVELLGGSGSAQSSISEVFPMTAKDGTDFGLVGSIRVSYGLTVATGPILTFDNFVVDLANRRIDGDVSGNGSRLAEVQLFDIEAGNYLVADSQLAALLTSIYGVPVAAATPIGQATITPEPGVGLLVLTGFCLVAARTLIARRRNYFRS